MRFTCGVSLAWLLLAAPVTVAAQACPEQKLASPNGPGVAVTTSCRRMEGEFRNGLLHGNGKITHPGSRIEQGDFIRGRLWGTGRIVYEDGRVAEGSFVDGRMSGQGKLAWSDGRIHEGLFFNGSPAGPGRYRRASGEIFEGMFNSRGSLDGRGVRTQPDGTKMYGEFRDNEPVGEITLVKADGTEEKRGYTIFGRAIPADAPPAAAVAPKAPVAGAPAGDQPAQSAKDGSSTAGQVVNEVDRAVRGLRGLLGK